MHVVGIIAEYNPFHQGHAYQLRAIRESVRSRFDDDAAIIAVMSGSFTQRGEAAIFDKWQRADLAVRGGCQLGLPQCPGLRARRRASAAGARLCRDAFLWRGMPRTHAAHDSSPRHRRTRDAGQAP